METFNTSNINETIEFALLRNGVEYLYPNIEWKFNNRFIRILGQCSSNGSIEFSTKLWERATPNERRQVVIHETCHYIARMKYGHIDGWHKAHGAAWQQCMINCGVEPKRCHSVDNSGLRRKTIRYLASCSCGLEHLFTAGQVEKIARGSYYTCRQCHDKIKMTGQTKTII